jgi:very-short-patch-repair endonuclease
MQFLPYNKNLKDFSRELRSHSTLAKASSKSVQRIFIQPPKAFRKLHCRFLLSKLNLVIEIDGDSNFFAESVVEDIDRQQILEGFGLSFLRFLDIEVKKSMPQVLLEIGAFIDDWEVKNGINKSFFF